MAVYVREERAGKGKVGRRGLALDSVVRFTYIVDRIFIYWKKDGRDPTPCSHKKPSMKKRNKFIAGNMICAPAPYSPPAPKSPSCNNFLLTIGYRSRIIHQEIQKTLSNPDRNQKARGTASGPSFWIPRINPTSIAWVISYSTPSFSFVKCRPGSASPIITENSSMAGVLAIQCLFPISFLLWLKRREGHWGPGPCA